MYSSRFIENDTYSSKNPYFHELLDNNNLNSNTLILNPNKNTNANGRINLLEPLSTDVMFQMQEKIAIKNKATNYREALVGTFEENNLSRAYFSAENIQIIQNGLRAGVYEMSNEKFVILPQNIDTLKVIMKSIYMQYAENYTNNVTEEIVRLNNLVLDYAVPTVYKEAIGYMKYIEDQSTIAMPLAVPRHHDRQYKQLELKNYF
jgi:hypothetical protein